MVLVSVAGLRGAFGAERGFEGGGDGGVVGGGRGEGGLGEPPAGSAGERAGVGVELGGDEPGVVGGGRHDGDVLEVFGGRSAPSRGRRCRCFRSSRANGNAGLGGGLLKGIQVDHDHVDRLRSSCSCDGCHVPAFAANVEEAAVDLGVQGFDAAVEHLGEAGEVGDVADGEAGFAEGPGGAAGRDELDAMPGERAGEVEEAGFIGDGEEGAADGLEIGFGRVHTHQSIWRRRRLRISEDRADRSDRLA